MTTETTLITERRRDRRVEWKDIIRWKRPGRIEDHQAWAADRSPTSLGFLTVAEAAPSVGDTLHVRRLDYDRWAIVNDTVRVARVQPIGADTLTLVGCTVDRL